MMKTNICAVVCFFAIFFFNLGCGVESGINLAEDQSVASSRQFIVAGEGEHLWPLLQTQLDFSKMASQRSIKQPHSNITTLAVIDHPKSDQSRSLAHRDSMMFAKIDIDIQNDGLENLNKNMAALVSSGDLLLFEANESYALHSESFNHNARQVVSNSSWWLEQAKIPEAFASLSIRQDSTCSGDHDPVVIAVLDSGFDIDHSAFRGKLWVNPQPNQFGCENDYFGCNVSPEDRFGDGEIYPNATGGFNRACRDLGNHLHSSLCKHGTHVAGVILGDHSRGVAGVCPCCKVLPIKVLDFSDSVGVITDASIIKALSYIRTINRSLGRKIKVVNLSLGKPQWSEAVALMIKSLQDEGVLFVASAGNDGSASPAYPAAYFNVLGVSATNATLTKAAYSNFGYWVDLAAPGGEGSFGILSAVPGGRHSYATGTSVAAPIVAGVAGLLWSHRPNLRSSDIRNLLIQSATKHSKVNENQRLGSRRKKKYTPPSLYGLLNAEAAANFDLATVTDEFKASSDMAGCATVGMSHKNNLGGVSFLLILLMPLIILCHRFIGTISQTLRF